MSHPNLSLSADDVAHLLLAKEGNCVPIFATIPADLLTPVLVYLRLTDGCTASTRGSFLLESCVQGAFQGRFSFIGVDPLDVLRTGDTEALSGDPLVHLEATLDRYKPVGVHGVPPFCGGAVGFIAYDCVRHFDPVAFEGVAPVKDPLGLPESVLMICDTVVAFDHLFRSVKIISHVFVPGAEGPARTLRGEIERQYDATARRIYSIVDRLASSEAAVPLPAQPPIPPGPAAEAMSNIGKAGYEAHVTRLRDHIVRGDIIQAVPSQRLSRPTLLHPFNAYRHLRQINPSPYMFYVDCGQDLQLVGASPECLCKVEDGKVFNHAIAGTIRRGKDAEGAWSTRFSLVPVSYAETESEDAKLAQELSNSHKDRAEHIMLVDLARNDVNRVCIPQTVQVDSLMEVERFSHVMHLTSQVSGHLRQGKTRFDAFRSIFPAGTVSGAPKIRAMQLISELEQEKRNVYAGAVGRFNFSQKDMDTCIAIRTMTFYKGIVYLQAGGGIVYDSVEEDEYVETINKLSSNLRTLEDAEAHYRGGKNVS